MQKKVEDFQVVSMIKEAAPSSSKYEKKAAPTRRYRGDDASYKRNSRRLNNKKINTIKVVKKDLK